MRVDTANQAYQIFGWLDQYPSNGMVKLYAQLLAAKLNIANGASNSSITSTLSEVDIFLANKGLSDWNFLSSYDRQKVLNWATILDNYNNGVTGPGHCPS